MSRKSEKSSKSFESKKKKSGRRSQLSKSIQRRVYSASSDSSWSKSMGRNKNMLNKMRSKSVRSKKETKGKVKRDQQGYTKVTILESSPKKRRATPKRNKTEYNSS